MSSADAPVRLPSASNRTGPGNPGFPKVRPTPMLLRSLSALACTAVLFTAAGAQQSNLMVPNNPPVQPVNGMKMPADPNPAMPSPPATANVMLGGSSILVTYNSPSMRGRTIMGGLVPYDQVWRTGANPATTLVTPVDLNIGTLKVPAGTYTLFTLPSSGQWQFIVSKKTGEWGIPYPEGSDLGRVPMKKKDMGTPQEVMSITFENTAGNRTELHVKWEKTDEFVTVSLAK